MTTISRFTQLTALLLLVLGVTLTGCNPDDDDEDIDTPETYSFDNVDYSGQTARIELLARLSGKVGDIENGESVSQQELRDIFENNNEISADKDLASKTYNQGNAASDIWRRSDFEQWFSDVTDNATGDTIADGRFFTANGVELQQYIEKGLMGAVFYYQATSVYLQDLDEDSNESEDGEASDRAHHFDEAFGYLGVPKNFLSNDADAVDGDYTNSAWFWGHYILSRESVLEIREPLFNAFLEGRTAIVNGDSEARQNAVSEIKTLWEKLVAANVVHYINSTLSDISNTDKYSKWHHWAEAKAFHMCLRYNIDKSISNSDWDYVDSRLKETPKNISVSELEEANSKLQEVFNFSDSEMANL